MGTSPLRGLDRRGHHARPGRGGLTLLHTAFYYNDLYDLRVVRSFSLFASRLLQSFGVALMLLALFYTIVPDAGMTEGAFVSGLLVAAGLLVPLRAVGYTIMRRRAFADRVLVLGAGAVRPPGHP